MVELLLTSVRHTYPPFSHSLTAHRSYQAKTPELDVNDTTALAKLLFGARNELRRCEGVSLLARMELPKSFKVKAEFLMRLYL
jgi:hypothetical protein